MTKFHKLIDGVELYVVLVLLFVGLALGFIINQQINISDVSLQSWSTVGLFIIGVFSWRSARASVKQAKLANNYLFYSDRKEVYSSIDKLVNYVDSTHIDDWNVSKIREHHGAVSLSKVCFPLNPSVYDNIYSYWYACLTVSSKDKLSGHYIIATDVIKKEKGESLLSDILKDIHNN